MTTTPAEDPWAAAGVARWLRRVDERERTMAPIADVLFAAAALRPGERVLDVGCGSGPTTRRAAGEVGPTGRVVGLDISPDMLTAAKAEPVDDGAAPLDWVAADAVTWRPDQQTYDVVISRFGVMFFSDPPAAFHNLAAATRPGGRLAMAVWDRRDRIELFEVPLRAAIDELRRRHVDVPVPPAGDGPFSLHDPAAVDTLLARAGWSEVHCRPHHLTLTFAGGQTPEEATDAILESGPVRPVAADLPDDHRAAVRSAVTAALTPHVDADGHVVLGARIILITANRPDHGAGVAG